MRTFACLMMLAGCALAGRLENTYLPPPGAAQAGGANLATPFSGPPQNTYLPPSGAASGSGSALRAGSSGSSGIFSSGSAFNSGSSFSSGSGSFSSGSGSFSAGSGSFSGSSLSSAGRFGSQQAAGQVNSYSSGSYQQPTPRPALIIKQVNENPGDGTYTFSYETENGIQAEERGQIRADGAEGLVAVQGAYAFTAPDSNQRYTVTYTADENGFLAYGDHLPTPPPVPAEILRALEQNAADEARGLVDDGQYRAEHQGEHEQRQRGFLRGGSSSSSSSSSGYNYNNAGNANAAGNNNGGYRY